MTNATSKAPRIPVQEFKRTKIIATVGPAVDSYESILELIKAGANGLRLNFSHGTYDERERQINWIRKASLEYGKPVAIIQDLQGPKIRLGDFEGIIPVKIGQRLTFKYMADYEATGHIPVQYDLAKKVKRGERLYLYDGKVRVKITSISDEVIHTEAENSGVLMRRKGINLPDTDFGGDIITRKDKKDIAFGSENDMDYVALSFVQTPQDILNLKRMLKNLGSNAHVIAKIETKAAVDNLEAIAQASDGIMVARNDLAYETLPESVPIVQRRVIGLGLKYNKPTIVASQMLMTMMETPEPTRAEVSDVATAVLIGADCLMLSDETANGNYPLEAVKVMKRVILYTQHNAPLRTIFEQPPQISKQLAIAKAIIKLADAIDADAIVAETKSGATALQISGLRAPLPVIAVTSDVRVSNQLALVYGTKSYVRPDDKLAATKLTNWLQSNKVLKKGDTIVTCSGKYPGVVGTTDTIKVRILE